MTKHYTRRITALTTLCLALAVPAAVLANHFEQQLANGLRVIVKKDRRAPAGDRRCVRGAVAGTKPAATSSA